MQHPWFSDQATGLIQVGRPFVKMHGLRNDFVIVDGREKPYTPSVAEIVRICDRHPDLTDHTHLCGLSIRMATRWKPAATLPAALVGFC